MLDLFNSTTAYKTYSNNIVRVHWNQCDQLLKYKVGKFSKSDPKSRQELFLFKDNVLTKEPKILPNILATFVRKLVGKNFQK